MIPANRSAREKVEGGFTLLEILVTVMIFGLLTSSVFYFLGQQTSLSSKTQDSQEGLSLAKLTIDSLKVSDYDSLVAGYDQPNDRFLRSWHVTVTQDDDGHVMGSKQVSVTVYWPASRDHNVSMTSLVSDDKYKEGDLP